MTPAELSCLRQIIEDFQGELTNVGRSDYAIVGIPDDLLARLDAYRGGKTRPQAIRELLDAHLPS